MSLTPNNLGLKFLIFILFILVTGYALFYRRGESLLPVLTMNLNNSHTVYDSESKSDIHNVDEEDVLGKYEDYDPSKLIDVSEEVRTILFFYADWSTESIKINNILSDLKIKSNTKVFLVLFDDFVTLREKYNVKLPNTFIEVNGAGDEIGRWNKEGLNELIESVKI